METAFDAIGIELSNKTAFNALAEDVGKRAEISRLKRKSGVLYGRCLKLGEGLEVWNMLYESGTGEVFDNYRPAFRARYSQKISPWILTEFDEEGEAIIHGFLEDSETEVLFELQNLTEIGNQVLEEKTIKVGLCGLANSAEVFNKEEKLFWRSYDELALNIIADENLWSLCGKVLAFEEIRNPFSGTEIYWFYLDTGNLKIEVLAGKKKIKGAKIKIGSFLKADIWLQGHILNKFNLRSTYEGVDPAYQTIDFWKKFKRLN